MEEAQKQSSVARDSDKQCEPCHCHCARAAAYFKDLKGRSDRVEETANKIKVTGEDLTRPISFFAGPMIFDPRSDLTGGNG